MFRSFSGVTVEESGCSHLVLWRRRLWYGDVQRSLERAHVCDTENVILKTQSIYLTCTMSLYIGPCALCQCGGRGFWVVLQEACDALASLSHHPCLFNAQWTCLPWAEHPAAKSCVGCSWRTNSEPGMRESSVLKMIIVYKSVIQ